MLTNGTATTTLELGATAASPGGSLGSGGLGLSGTGETDGVPSGGVGRIGVGGTHVATLTLQQPSTSSGLAPEIVQRVLKQNVARLRYCYDKALTVTPGLVGALEVAFTIGPDGGVTTATATGLGDTVGGCVVTVLRSLAFPRPERGLSVNVLYPMRGATVAAPALNR